MAKDGHPLVGRVRRDMADTWHQDDQLLEKFFPIEPAANYNYRKARKAFFNDNKRYKRWKGISATPKSLSSLHRPLTNLMNGILFHYGISRDDRLFLDTHFRHVEPTPRPRISPGIYLSGVGKEFATTRFPLPRAVYPSGVSAIEVTLDSADLTEARDRLAVHMHHIFQNQDNRRFAFGLVITQTVFIVYMFDHSGAVASATLNYHDNAEQFCAVISGLASKEGRIGFDMNIFGEVIHSKIRTFEALDDGTEVERWYRLDGTFYQFHSLVGRGTICWLATEPEDPEATLVIKDAWVAPSGLAGRESEGSLLRHARAQGVVTGVVQIRHFEQVRRSADASDLDTVLRNRQAQIALADERRVERIHSRIVMSTHGKTLQSAGKTLDRFETRREFLLAFHDAVLAHRRLYEVAGILHRDISARNILINSEGMEGNRGILIDFDHSIRVGDTSPYSTKTKIGTWRYMSRNVLEAKGPHTYFDDLESFYYVFCWIVVTYECPGTGKEEVPPLIAQWDKPDSLLLKYGHFGDHFRLPVSPYFGDSLHRLAVRLNRFIKSRFGFIGKPLSSLDPAKDYDEFLSHIRQAIADLGAEPDPTKNTVSLSIHNTSRSRARSTSSLQKRDQPTESKESYSSTPSPPTPRPRLGRIAAPPREARRRRKNANYKLAAIGQPL